jgi:plasmid stability protein
MTTLTIRNVEPDIKARLRQVAALHGRSMEEEVRVILRRVLAQPTTTAGLGSRIQARFAANGEVDIPLPQRAETARAASFGDEAAP